eukprot:131254-Pleurochrysis_carterae.AAC.1
MVVSVHEHNAQSSRGRGADGGGWVIQRYSAAAPRGASRAPCRLRARGDRGGRVRQLCLGGARA